MLGLSKPCGEIGVADLLRGCGVEETLTVRIPWNYAGYGLEQPVRGN